MAKLNATQQAIVKAVSNYREGSRALVMVFETVIQSYWTTDSCNPVNVEFFLNAIKRFPQIQNAVRTTLLPKFGKFEIKQVSGAGKDKEYTVANWKPEEGEQGITKADKLAFREAVRSFIANEYTSLLHEKKVAEKMNKAFDMDKSAKSVRNSIMSQIKAAIADGQNLDILRNLVTQSVEDAFKTENIREARQAVEKAKQAA